jgi:hypothetical protein
MNETKFVTQLKNSFRAEAADENRPEPVVYKIRGSASTAGRPDLLVIDAGKTFFIEAKYVKVRDRLDLLLPVTDLQRTHLENIIAAGGNAFLATAFEKKGGCVNRYGLVLVLHEMIDDELKLPKRIVIQMGLSKDNEFTFTLPKHSFLIFQRKSKWANTEFFRGNCV